MHKTLHYITAETIDEVSFMTVFTSNAGIFYISHIEMAYMHNIYCALKSPLLQTHVKKIENARFWFICL